MEGLQDKYNNSPKEENKWQKETDLEPIRSDIWQIGIPEREKKVNRKEEMIKKKPQYNSTFQNKRTRISNFNGLTCGVPNYKERKKTSMAHYQEILDVRW